MDDEEECEMEDHDPAIPRVPAIRIPRVDFGSFAICEVCLKDVFETVTLTRPN
ncbi:hypothetical protein J4G48_0015425 [Bradyrhizobium barranii subsp. apii]|uniref:hypothetical protein n=1 Tax=Bradyrhizobium barranii TaxID=2992140 RepID=UPI001AA14734|nr:hypothetical protein [Bradyrhizobium barranii]UPT99354.1 hypothetical protein J4G48_0015425 [Bradyrhizobium barranii subsp. apii]